MTNPLFLGQVDFPVKFVIMGEVKLSREELENFRINTDTAAGGIFQLKEDFFRFLLHQNASALFAKANLESVAAFDPTKYEGDDDIASDNYEFEESPFEVGDRVSMVDEKRKKYRVGTVTDYASEMGVWEITVLWDGNKNRTRWKAEELTRVNDNS